MISSEYRRFTDLILKNETWRQGYRALHALMQKPLGWFCIFEEGGTHKLDRLNRKKCCDFYAKSARNEAACLEFLNQAAVSSHEAKTKNVQAFTCHAGRACCRVPLIADGKRYGDFTICNLPRKQSVKSDAVKGFIAFLQGQVENVSLARQMEVVYEDLHPRALAMSTMHSVHRIISSSLDINDLLPRLTRFTSQVLGSEYAAIFLLDDKKQYLVKRFEMGSEVVRYPALRPEKIRRNRGVFGKIAVSGDFWFSKRLMAVPLIEDDVIGIIVVSNSPRGRVFAKVDLEVLKTVAEQAVIAIKNSQLLAYRDKVTSGSVEAIANIIDLKVTKNPKINDTLLERLAYATGVELKITKDERKRLLWAAKLLDAGFLGIPKAIQNKKEPLTGAEYEVIKTHPFRGVELIQSIDSLKPITPIILYQNERYDGKGYPHGLKGEEIPLCARIISLVTGFVAMISSRPYRHAKTVEAALEEISSLSGTQFDPKVIEAFMKVIRRDELQKIIALTSLKEA